MNKKILDFPLEVTAVEESGVIKGYGSIFGFGGGPDAHGDVVAEGAFKKTLKKGGRNGTGIAFLWQHQASAPLGVWTTMEERSKGLYVEGEMVLDTQLGREVHALAKAGAVKGLSIGYNTVVEEYDREKKISILKEVELWEVSVVTFPANTRARVEAVKAIREASTERELEHALRDAGLSHDEARYLVWLCKTSLRDAGGTTGSREDAAVLEAIRSTNAVLSGLYT